VQQVTDLSHRYYTDGRKAELEGNLTARDWNHVRAAEINGRALEAFKRRNGISDGEARSVAQGGTVEGLSNAPPGRIEEAASTGRPTQGGLGVYDELLFNRGRQGGGRGRGLPRFEYLPPSGDLPPTLILSDEAVVAYAGVAHQRNFRGITIAEMDALRAATRLESREDRKLAAALREAAGDAGRGGLIAIVPEAPVYTVREELFHVGQNELGGGEARLHLPEAAYRRVLDHKYTPPLVARLNQLGYRKLAPWQIVSELAAKIVGGEPEFMEGLNEEEALNWLDSYQKGDGKRVSKDESGTRSRGGGEGEEDPKK